MRPQHVDRAEAVQIHLDLRAKRSVGIHWGTFSLTDEPLDHAIDALAAARVQAGVAESSFFLTALGETRRLPARAGEPAAADGLPAAATATAVPAAAAPEGPGRRP